MTQVDDYREQKRGELIAFIDHELGERTQQMYAGLWDGTYISGILSSLDVHDYRPASTTEEIDTNFQAGVAFVQLWNLSNPPSNDPVACFGDWLTIQRAVYGLSLSEVSRRAGVAKGHLSEIEHNNSDPSLLVLKKIARVFNLTVGEMLTQAGIK